VSDHNPDEHRIVRARDLDDDDTAPGIEGIGRVIAETIRARRPGWVKYLIYHGAICSSYPTSTHPAWAWRPYSGPNAHLQHLHVSVNTTPEADQYVEWGLAPEQELDMEPEDVWDLKIKYQDPARGPNAGPREAAARVVLWSTRARVEELQGEVTDLRDDIAKLTKALRQAGVIGG
jgi:hypothetical protein